MKYIAIVFLLLLGVSSSGQDLENLVESLENKNPFQVTGAVSLNGLLSSIQGGEDRISPWSYNASARVTMHLYDVKIPFYFAYRNHSYHFGSSLPRFRISPKYKWAELQIGDVYSRWNPFVLSHRSIRGVGVKLTPGKLRIQAIRGKLRDLNSFRDTLQLGTVVNETYTRDVLGGLVGFGNRKSHIDFMLMRVKDNNLNVNQDGIRNQDNLIGGTTVKLRLARGLSLAGNFGLSMLTYDKNAIGQSITFDAPSISENFITVNSSTNASCAGDATLNFNTSNYGLNFKIRYIQAFYQPLTLAFVNTDVLDYTLGGKLSLFRHKLNLNGNVGFQNNNLSKQDAFTTTRKIYNLSANYHFNSNLHATIISNNFVQNLDAQVININDVITYSVNNALHTLIIGYQKANKVHEWRANLSIGRNSFSAISEVSENPGEFNGQFLRGDLSFEKVETQWRFDVGLFRNDYNQTNNENSTYGFQLSVNKSLMDQKLNLGLKSIFNFVDENEFREGQNLNLQFLSNYSLNEKSSLILSVMYIERNSVSYRDFSEWRSRMSVRYNF